MLKPASGLQLVCDVCGAKHWRVVQKCEVLTTMRVLGWRIANGKLACEACARKAQRA